MRRSGLAFAGLVSEFTVHPLRYGSTDCVRCSTQWIIVEVSVAGRGCMIGVPKKLADNWESHSAASADARERVPEIMNA
jgi:hypothetical protein